MNLKSLCFIILALGGAAWGYVQFGYTESSTPVARNTVTKNAKTMEERDSKFNDNKLSIEPVELNELAEQEENTLANQQKDLTTHLNYEQENIAPSVFKLDDIITEEDGSVSLNSELLEVLSLMETRDLISNLSSTITDPESQIIMDNISLGVSKDMEGYNGMVIETTSCSDKLCGVLFSSYNQNDVESFLNEITAKPHIKEYLRGGTLKIFEENGEHYGMLVGAIGTKPIKVR